MISSLKWKKRAIFGLTILLILLVDAMYLWNPSSDNEAMILVVMPAFSIFIPWTPDRMGWYVLLSLLYGTANYAAVLAIAALMHHA